jgi:hypothetical protein
MSSNASFSKGQPIPRTVERCEAYLDRLALVVERAGGNAHAFLPILRRLERELAEARQEEEMLGSLKRRLTGDRAGQQ